MHFFVEILTVKTIILDIEALNTTKDVNAKIQDKERIHADQLRLVFTQQFEDGRPLSGHVPCLFFSGFLVMVVVYLV